MFASLMRSGGGDLAAVSKTLGHSSTQQTANTYYDLRAGEKERAVNLLPLLTHEEPTKENEPQPIAGNVIPFRPRRTTAA